MEMPVARSELIKRVNTQADIELARVGMTRRKEGIYTRELGDDHVGWLGLNRAVHRGDGALELNPVVGVRNQQLERLVAQLSDQPFHEYIPPSVSVHVGYLGAERRYLPWLFDEKGQVDKQVRRMADAVVRDSFPFMEANLGLKNLVAALKKYAPRQSQRVRVPAALLLLGEHDRACEFAENELREMAKATTAANDQYRLFVRTLCAARPKLDPELG
jgi:hypothetical protein